MSVLSVEESRQKIKPKHMVEGDNGDWWCERFSYCLCLFYPYFTLVVKLVLSLFGVFILYFEFSCPFFILFSTISPHVTPISKV